eukprot:5291206-Amphidinium_carterae.1
MGTHMSEQRSLRAIRMRTHPLMRLWLFQTMQMSLPPASLSIVPCSSLCLSLASMQHQKSP